MKRGRTEMDRKDMIHLHSLLKVPQECASREFRLVQKQSEKEVASSVSLLQELGKRVETQSDVNWSKVLLNLSKVEERLESVKQNLLGAASKSESLFASAQARTKFAEDASQEDYFSLLMIDHLVRRDLKDVASELAKDTGQEDLVDVVVFEEVASISKELRENHNIDPALKWCSSNKSKLKRLNSSLEFQLRRFGFLQLVQQCKHVDAVQYAKKYLSTFAGEYMEEIQETVAALAFTIAVPNATNHKREGEMEDDSDDRSEKNLKKRRLSTTPEPCRQSSSQEPPPLPPKPTASSNVHVKKDKSPLSSEEWELLAKLFEFDSNRALSLQQPTTLQATLYAGLASLRTPDCSPAFRARFLTSQAENNAAAAERMDVDSQTGLDVEHAGQQERMQTGKRMLKACARAALNCPCCCESLGKVALELPYAHQVLTQLLCPVTGKLMNENNPPMRLPNGQVYSFEAVRARAEDDVFECPLSHQRFPLAALKKVYLS